MLIVRFFIWNWTLDSYFGLWTWIVTNVTIFMNINLKARANLLATALREANTAILAVALTESRPDLLEVALTDATEDNLKVALTPAGGGK